MTASPEAIRALTLEQRAIVPTQVEQRFGLEEVIVSKTDTAGRITYANEVFCRIAMYKREELIGVQHNIIRHPDMPRCVFKLLWDTIGAGNEIFAYVKNLCRNGDYYWVFAHVTPTFDEAGNIIGYHSNRRSPDRKAVNTFASLYAELLRIEQSKSDRKDGLQSATDALISILNEKGLTYDEFIFTQTAA